jgi:transcription elongation factor GreB
MTPAGYRTLQERVALARAANDENEAARAEALLEQAVVLESPPCGTDVVAFGAAVTVAEGGKKRQTYRIVGEDEADPLHGSISWRSPLAHALLDHHTGDRVVWERPAGNIVLEIASIGYDS